MALTWDVWGVLGDSCGCPSPLVPLAGMDRGQGSSEPYDALVTSIYKECSRPKYQ